ncbi:circumsporozoite protein [Sphingomonas sp. GV3]|uniref:circumsporozoite protein n=1 Tax=Sphingomonas sp. GV3 TaxID=3040671 RepID=UPI00280B63DC|nr:circumsporozoite protein [Sphingomonas sp. GV3]
MKTRFLLPFAVAATLGLAACGGNGAANNAAAADETLTLNEEGGAGNDAIVADGGNLDAPADNQALPADVPGNAAATNAL